MDLDFSGLHLKPSEAQEKTFNGQLFRVGEKIKALGRRVKIVEFENDMWLGGYLVVKDSKPQLIDGQYTKVYQVYHTDIEKFKQLVSKK